MSRDDAPAAPSEAGLSLQVRRGDPTPEELAAVMAVVTEAYQVEASTALADDEPEISAWQVSARALREPLRRELGWRG
ncbi:acyl-CoA carboxylase subunit epsilon [Microbacterium invictum]|uniref:Cobalamin biosynthesis protein CobT n=1 Tax=Microbacterium invictum TaxID=515415 RepID=A0AA40SP25_9MICO|nr:MULTISPECIES: acyl-CoA carboxylase subunit epsilon [Microbacterium]MBB4139792.1 cobalamin biosynthesis protein CobT [Microbacterium invictum]